jgi:acetyl esterase
MLSIDYDVAFASAKEQALTGAGVAGTLQLIPGTRPAEGYPEHAVEGTLTFLRQVLA